MYSEEFLQYVQDLANDRIEEILELLGFDIDSCYTKNNEIRSRCIIHDGKTGSSFSYSLDKKQWRCYSSNCHNGNPFISGLVKKCLSKNENREVSFNESVEWICSFLGITASHSNINDEKIKINKLVKEARLRDTIIKQEAITKIEPFPVERLNGNVQPSPYFLKMGFSERILRKYNVGLCLDPRKPMNLRSYFPILNEDGTMVIGVTGRIIYDKCDYCPKFHEKGLCPKDNPKVKSYPKWLHWGFHKNNVLFNQNFALSSIEKTKSIIVTEGAKDILWMSEHDINNCVPLLGLFASNYHIKRFMDMGVNTVVLAFNRDKHGQEATESLKEQMGVYFNLIDVSPLIGSHKDIAEIPSSEMINEFAPFVRKI